MQTPGPAGRPIDRAPVLLVGPVPPPINGLSVAFGALVDGLDGGAFSARVVDIADRAGSRRGGSFSLARATKILSSVAKVWAGLPRARTLYVTIAQSRMGFLRDLAICAPAILLGKKLVLHLNGGNFKNFYEAQPAPLRALARWMLSGAERIIVLSECLRAEFSMVPRWEERTAVVWNPSMVPVERPRPRPSGVLRVLYLSNLLVEKGYRDVLRAIPALVERLPGWRVEVHLAGAFQIGRDSFRDVDEMRADYDALVAALPPAASATWHGVVSGEAKRELLRSCDVFVLPTYYVNEGQPLSIMEALSAGLPVVATAYRAIPEMLPASLLPLTVPPRDPDAIARALAPLALDGEGYERLSREAVEHARLFDPPLYVERVAELL